MKKSLVIMIILIVVMILALVVIFVFPKKPAKNVNVNVAPTNANVNVEIKNSVYIKDASFSPSVLTIKVGETVTWVNQDPFKHKIASDPHPTHTDLPELLSGDLGEGETYNFTFKKAGQYSYHDELNPIKKGIIKVE